MLKMKSSLIIFSVLLIYSLCACDTPSKELINKKRIITFENTPAKRPYSPAVESGNMLFVSGQIGTEASTGKLVEGGIEAEARKTLTNLKNVVERAGYSMTNIVRCTVLLSDIAYYGIVNQIYMEFFPEDPPARMAFAVKDLPLGALIEIDAIAVR
jgi:2-iminobutanoate/2-iminopropanoate deaminase